MIDLLKQLKLDYRIRAGYGLAFILLLISYLLTWYANQQVITQSQWLSHTNSVVTHLEGLASYLKDAETGVRGYLVTKDETFLEPYNSSSHNVDSTFAYLKKETADNTTEQIRIYTVKRLIDEKFDVLALIINDFRQDGLRISDRVMKESYTGKVIMDSMRNEIQLMNISERELLKARRTGLQSRYTAMNAIIVTSLVLAFLFALLGLITFMRENKARRTADKKVTEYQEQLQKRIEELDVANKELIQMRRTEQFAATGRIARTIAHEVRNPLTNIDLAVAQLKMETKDMDENTTVLFEMINRNSKRINQLITELLNTTRFVELNFQAVSINELLDQALELAKDRIFLNHIKIEKKYSDNIRTVSVDGEKVKIAFLNIIVNAVEAIESDNGLLIIITKEENGKCVVQITDNGIGMDATALGKLFEPYNTTKPKGNGLGLANTQNIILNHKGIINVESKPGAGTTFIIKFDLTQDASS